MRRNKEGHINIDPTIPTMIALTIAAFVTGLFVYGTFLLPPHQDLKADYCRGVADEAHRTYTAVRSFFSSLEDQAEANGDIFVGAFIAPDGAVIQVTSITEQLMPELVEDYVALVEEVCMSLTPQETLDMGNRGPTDMIPPTPTTTLP